MQPVSFQRSDLTITSSFPRLPWETTRPEDRNTVHWGQRKLTLAEIEFFSLYWDPRKIPQPLCIHVGDPGLGISALAQLFPAITFHVYHEGKRPANIPNQVTFFNETFTDKSAEKYRGQDNIFFISDYRSTDYLTIENEIYRLNNIARGRDGQPQGDRQLLKDLRRQAERANEEAIAKDMSDQQRWFLLINPVHGLLKFRPPYALSRTDQGFAYLAGRVYWQPWTRPTSTETRLKPVRNKSGNYEVVSDWSVLEYEEWCFYHNTVRRERVLYRNPLTDEIGPIAPPDLQADYDSALEVYILTLYWRRFQETEDNLKELVVNSSRYLTFVLNNQHPDPMTWTTLASKRSVLTSARTPNDPFSAQPKPETLFSPLGSRPPPELSSPVESQSFPYSPQSPVPIESSVPILRSTLQRTLSPGRPTSPPPQLLKPTKKLTNTSIIPDFANQEEVVIDLTELGVPSVSREDVVDVEEPMSLANTLVEVERKPIVQVIPTIIPQRSLANFPKGRPTTTVLEELGDNAPVFNQAPVNSRPISTSQTPKAPPKPSAPKLSAPKSSAKPMLQPKSRVSMIQPKSRAPGK